MKYLSESVLLLCCMVLSSCTKQVQKQQMGYDIPFDSVTSEWPATTSIEYIPLETNDSSLIGKISKIIFCNDRFYIFDQVGKKVVLFNRKGEFLKSIHKVGQGPGEYTDPYDMDVDDEGNVYLSDIVSQNIIVYRNGDECDYETIHVGEYFLEFAVKGNTFFLGTVYRDGLPVANLAAYDRKTKQVTLLKENQLPEGNALPLAAHYLYRSNGNVFFQERFRPIIYRLQENGDTLAVAQLETSRVPNREEIAAWAACSPMEQMQKRLYYFSDVAYYENDSYVFLTSMGTKVLFNKNNLKTYCTKGVPDYAKILGKPVCATCGDRFISYIAPGDEYWQEHFPAMEEGEQKEKISRLSEEDNPVLALFGFEE